MPASGAVGSCPTPPTAGQASPRLRGSRDTAHKVRVLLAHHPQELPAALAPGWAMWDMGTRTVECCRPGPSGSVPSGTPRCQGCWGGTSRGGQGSCPAASFAPRARSESGVDVGRSGCLQSFTWMLLRGAGRKHEPCLVGPLGLFQLPWLCACHVAGVELLETTWDGQEPPWPLKPREGCPRKDTSTLSCRAVSPWLQVLPSLFRAGFKSVFYCKMSHSSRKPVSETGCSHTHHRERTST